MNVRILIKSLVTTYTQVIFLYTELKITSQGVKWGFHNNLITTQNESQLLNYLNYFIL